MNNQEFRLLGYQKISGIIKCKTGLRIGGSSETIEIGGLDNPVIKHPLTKEPYIPGSSLKGKMRSLLELRYSFVDSQEFLLDQEGKPRLDKAGKTIRNPEYGAVHKYKGKGCKEEKCPICRIFGVGAGEGSPFGPGRLVIRDANLERLSGQTDEQRDLTQTEIKWENVINRIRSSATPRQMERVPAGAEFSFEMNYKIFDVGGDNGEVDKKLFDYVPQGLKLIEIDTLGGSGSRGYGKVEFGIVKDDKFESGKVKITSRDGMEQERSFREMPLEEISL